MTNIQFLETRATLEIHIPPRTILSFEGKILEVANEVIRVLPSHGLTLAILERQEEWIDHPRPSHQGVSRTKEELDRILKANLNKKKPSRVTYDYQLTAPTGLLRSKMLTEMEIQELRAGLDHQNLDVVRVIALLNTINAIPNSIEIPNDLLAQI